MVRKMRKNPKEIFVLDEKESYYRIMNRLSNRAIEGSDKRLASERSQIRTLFATAYKKSK